MSKSLRYLTSLWLLIFRRGTYVGGACYSLPTAISEQIHTEQIMFAIDTSHLKALYTASKEELTGQVNIVNGSAVLPTYMCHTLSAGYDIHYFHPKAELDKLEGHYCLNTIFLKGTELAYTMDEHRKPKIQSFKAWKESMKVSYQFDVNLTKDPRDRILIWSGQLKVDYLNSSISTNAIANDLVHEANHLINEIIEKEGKILQMISKLEKFMSTAQPSVSSVSSKNLGEAMGSIEQLLAATSGSRTKRNLLDFLLGPNLGLFESIIYNIK